MWGLLVGREVFLAKPCWISERSAMGIEPARMWGNEWLLWLDWRPQDAYVEASTRQNWLTSGNLGLNCATLAEGEADRC